MNAKRLNRMFARAMYCMVIAAMVFSVTGNAYAQEPTPWLIAFPENDAVEGWEWPDAATVYLTIDNAPEGFIRTGTAQVTTWGDPRTYVRFDFGGEGGYNLNVGDKVTLTDEFGTTAIHTVQYLSVTDANGETDTVTGTSYNGAFVQVWPHGFDQGYTIDIPVGEDGIWVANFADLGFRTIEDTGGRSWIVIDGNATAVDWNVPAPPPSTWRDDFDGSLLDGWYWKNGDTGEWSLNDAPGFLRIYASDTSTPDGNLLLRGAANSDFMIKTRLLFEPDTNFQIAGLVIWQDDQNYLQFGRAYCDPWCVGNAIYFDKILGGNGVDGNFGTQVNSANEAYLRLERRGEMVKAFYGFDGFTWYEMGTHWIPSDFQVNAVGLTASQDYSDVGVHADFDFFELTEGWGFLPEGFHDFDQGDVPSWACNAGGWAADPDDRAAPVNIDVIVDDISTVPLVADVFRQDLLDAGVCEGGNCSFSTSLWDAISSYEPHRVDVWAQDDTGDWVLLTNSAKTLTCRTYDIYAYDPLTGETKHLSNIRDADEYDPSWSPDGKKFAHDVVTGDTHGIYITNVQTGVSTPLKGAQNGGNDAAWSPNGSQIVFDRRWFDDPSLYRVPSVGGIPKLVRHDAVNAAWSPNGRFLAFHQPSDGSIRTIFFAAPGGSARFIGYGEEPAWSPDGKWIAYTSDGDIWKVRVDVLGAALGGPIQVTSGPFGDGGPTWSRDSTKIIYNTGISRDYDLWSVPAAGGTPTWLTGAPEFGEYGPAQAKNSSNVAYASFSPNGQAARSWVAAFTYDAGTWDEGSHTYQFWTEGAPAGEERSLNVSIDNPLYPGLVLIRPGTIRAETPDGCANIEVIHPYQQTRFHVGWTFDGVYADARMYLENLEAQIRWDTTEPTDMLMHEIFPFTGSVDWFGYTCTFTTP